MGRTFVHSSPAFPKSSHRSPQTALGGPELDAKRFGDGGKRTAAKEPKDHHLTLVRFEVSDLITQLSQQTIAIAVGIRRDACGLAAGSCAFALDLIERTGENNAKEPRVHCRDRVKDGHATQYPEPRVLDAVAGEIVAAAHALADVVKEHRVARFVEFRNRLTIVSGCP